MNVKRAALVALFQALGIPSVTKWSDARMITKLNKIQTLLKDDETKKPTDKADKALLKQIVAAVEAGEEFEIVEDEAPAKADKKAAKAEKETSAKKSKKAKAPADDEEDAEEEEEEESEDDDEDGAEEEEDSADDEESEDEESEDEESEDEDESDDEEDEEEEEKPAKKSKKADKKKSSKNKDGDELVDVKKKKAPKKAVEKGPGVIASIVEFLQAASEAKPISKDKLADKLKARFAERDRDAMMKTINVQVPNRIKMDKKLNVVKGEKGYWIDGAVKAKKSK